MVKKTYFYKITGRLNDDDFVERPYPVYASDAGTSSRYYLITKHVFEVPTDKLGLLNYEDEKALDAFGHLILANGKDGGDLPIKQWLSYVDLEECIGAYIHFRLGIMPDRYVRFKTPLPIKEEREKREHKIRMLRKQIWRLGG